MADDAIPVDLQSLRDLGDPAGHALDRATPARPRRAGLLKGRIVIADDFDRLPDDVVNAIEDSGAGHD